VHALQTNHCVTEPLCTVFVRRNFHADIGVYLPTAEVASIHNTGLDRQTVAEHKSKVY